MSNETCFEEFEIQPLGDHNRAAFSCGKFELDKYLKEQASQDKKKGAANTFVLIHAPTNKIAGYYTLSNTSIKLSNVPADIKKKMAKYDPANAIIIGRLARDIAFAGKGVGEHILMEAIHHAYRIGMESAWAVIIVDAKDESAKAFYEKYDFIYVQTENEPPYRLILPKTKVDKLFKEAFEEVKT